MNLVLIAYVAFASWAIWRFAESLGASEMARWVASCAYVGSAWLSCELHNGITEAANIGPVALALCWTEEAAQSEERKAWVKAGLGVGLSALASPYLGLGTGLVVLIRGLPHLKQAWIGGLVACLVAAPPILALRSQLRAEDAIIKHPGAMNEQLALHNAVDPRTFFEPLGFRSVDLSAEGFEHSMYLGWIVLVLALLSLRGQARRLSAPALWLAGALVCLILSLGPYLFWDGAWLMSEAGARYRLPWWSLQQLAPGLAITHPLRLAVPALTIVSGLAALGISRRLHGWPVLAVAALVGIEGLVFSGSPWPIATTDARAPAVYEEIARESDTLEWGVLDLPTDAGPTMATSRYLFWQSSHRLPIPYGPDARASTNVLLDRPYFKALASLSNRRPDENKRMNLDHPGSGGTNPAQLQVDGIRWIVVHRDLDEDAAQKTIEAIEQDLGEGREVDGAVIWDLVP